MTVVEAALVVPLMFLFVFGLLDLGLWVFESTQAAGAARDGARAAILDYRGADVPGSADAAKVRTAATRHIDVRGPTVAVRCLRQDDSSVVCAHATPGADRIEVRVSWPRRTLTFVGDLLGESGRRVSGASTMSVTGRPAGLA